MPRYIVKLAEGEYVEWSTVVDAPITAVLDRETMVDLLTERGDHPEVGANTPTARLDRADERGHSATWFGPRGPERLVAGNRAGDDESELTLAEVRELYAPDEDTEEGDER